MSYVLDDVLLKICVISNIRRILAGFCVFLQACRHGPQSFTEALYRSAIVLFNHLSIDFYPFEDLGASQHKFMVC